LHFSVKLDEEIANNSQRFRAAYTIGNGHHLVVYSRDPETVLLPEHFIKVVRHRTCVTFTTRDIVKYNGFVDILLIQNTLSILDRLTQSVNEMMLASNVLITELLSKLRPHIACLYALSETVGLTDMLVSIAAACSQVKSGIQLILF
jgi:hypothetical protein